MEASDGMALQSIPVQHLQRCLPTAGLSVGRGLELVCSEERQAAGGSFISFDSLMQFKTHIVKAVVFELAKTMKKAQLRASSSRKQHTAHQVSSE